MNILTPISPTIYPGLWPSAKIKFLSKILMTDDTKTDIIVSVICEHFNIPPDLVKSKYRKREVVEARQVIMYFLKLKTKLSLKAIGEIMGGRDHSTVIYGCQVVEDIMHTNNKFKKDMLAIQQLLINVNTPINETKSDTRRRA